LAAKGAVQVVGVRELRQALRNLPPDFKVELKTLHAQAAKPVEREAARRAPSVTGRLRASIRSSGTQRSGVVRAGKKAVPYAGPIHFGWPARNIRPQPFLTDALRTEQDKVVDIMFRGLDRLISRAFDYTPPR